MGKKKKAPPPPAPVYIPPQPIIQLTPSAEEQELNNKRLEQLSDLETKIANFRNQDSLFQKDLEQRYNTARSQGIRDIKDIYNPMFSTTREDINSRLGTLNTSDLAKSYNQLEKNRGKAIADLVNALVLDRKRQEDIYLNNLLNARSAILGGKRDYYDTMSNAYGMGLNYANSANNFNTNLYNTQTQRYINDRRNNSGLLSQGIRGGGILANTFLNRMFPGVY